MILGLLGFPWPTVAGADPITDKIEKERKTLDQLKGQIEETRKQADEAGKKRESLLQGIQTLDERVVHYRQTHQEISRKLRKKDQEIEEINTQLAGLRASVRERQDAILARLRVQYMEGRFGYWKTLLASDSYGDFQRRLQYLSSVSERDYALMGTFRADMTHMEQAERQREEARIGMVSYKQSTEKQLAEMKAVKRVLRTCPPRVRTVCIAHRQSVARDGTAPPRGRGSAPDRGDRSSRGEGWAALAG
jgi:peptidoglycan hydrolase CwlO-like protein